MSTPNHGNVGDQAIAYAQKYFLNKNFPHVKYFELTSKDTIINLEFIRKNISKRTIVFIHGGRNFGNLYPQEEKIRQDIIKSLIYNPIISFPQSIFLDKSDNSNDYLNNIINVYSSHKNLTLIAREEESYNFLKKVLPNNLILEIPDIVIGLSNELRLEDEIRQQTSLCLLRNDKEKHIDDNFINELNFFLKENFKYKTVISDTQLGGGHIIEIEDRAKLLMDFWQDMTKYNLVITDRLHGMIFSFITQTPCIVLKNNNHKIESTYKSWLSSSNKILYIDNSRQINEPQLRVFMDNIHNPTNNIYKIEEQFVLLTKHIENILIDIKERK